MDCSKRRPICRGSGTCGRFQKTNARKGRPTNNGDTATTATCDLERNFDNLFNPFSKTFNKANQNDQGKPIPEHIPFAKTGTGAANRDQSCRVNGTCQRSDNDNSSSKTCKLEQSFENQMKFVREK